MKTREELIAAAEVVTIYDGRLFDEAEGDGYYDSVEEFVQEWWDNYCGFNDVEASPEHAPDEYFLFCTTPIHPTTIFAGDIYNHIEEMAQVEDLDVTDHLEGMEAFEAAVLAFNEANKETIIGWSPDYTRVIKVTREEFLEEIEE